MKKVYLTLISSHLCFVNIINRYAFSQQHPTINLQLTTVIAVPIVMLFDLSGSTPLLAAQVYLSLLRAGSKGLIIFTVAPLNVATDAVSGIGKVQLKFGFGFPFAMQVKLFPPSATMIAGSSEGSGSENPATDFQYFRSMQTARTANNDHKLCLQ